MANKQEEIVVDLHETAAPSEQIAAAVPAPSVPTPVETATMPAPVVPDEPASVAPTDTPSTVSEPETQVPVADLPAQDDDASSGSPDKRFIAWTASEFIAHEKTSTWFMSLAGVATVLTVLIFVITRSVISSAAVIVGALLFGVYGAREPRELDYRLDESGLSAGDKHFPYSHFRSFTIIEDGAFRCIDFMPLKRFSPMITVYFHPDDEGMIVAMLGDYLPHQERQQDLVESLMRHVRF
jgi:hypothetical protein